MGGHGFLLLIVMYRTVSFGEEAACATPLLAG
jgi:hypothetical protein